MQKEINSQINNKMTIINLSKNAQNALFNQWAYKLKESLNIKHVSQWKVKINSSNMFIPVLYLISHNSIFAFISGNNGKIYGIDFKTYFLYKIFESKVCVNHLPV